MPKKVREPAKKQKSFPKLGVHITGQWYFRIPKVGFYYLGKDEEAAKEEYERLKLIFETSGAYPKKKTVTQKKMLGRKSSSSHSRTVLPANSPFTIRRQNGEDYYRVWVPTLKRTFGYGNVKDGHDLALEEYHKDLPSFMMGIDPYKIQKPISINSVGLFCSEYLKHQERKLEKGTIVAATIVGNRLAVERVRGFFGDERDVQTILPNDFRDFLDSFDDGSKSPTTLGNIVRDTKAIFNYGAKNILRAQIFFGDDFVKPDGKQVARFAKENPEKATHKYYEREEVLALLQAAPVNWMAAVLLGINAGIGNSDLAHLKFEDINPDSEYLRGVRQKNFRPRAAWLWPETREALREHLEWRLSKQAIKPEAKDFIFVTNHGNPMFSQGDGMGLKRGDQPVSKGFLKTVEERSGIEHKRGRSFYALRHTFNTIARNSTDIEAVQHVMGHLDHKDTGAKYYTHSITDERLQRVGHYVREWLFRKGESPFEFGMLAPWVDAT